MRRAQGDALGKLGFGPDECAYEVGASGPLWRLRRYPGDDAGPDVLLVPAPIKQPYIWDLAPSASVVRYCLEQGLRVRLLEWRPPTRQSRESGLSDYSNGAVSGAVAALTQELAALTQELGGSRPFIIGHSLGGTLAAIFAALHPERLSGLVILSAPLCLHPGVSAFRDSLVALSPPWLLETDIVPGSLLSQLSAMASPTTFVWSRLVDAAASATDARASDIRRRIERWALDEVPLSGKLVQEIFVQLYRENRLCRATLSIGDKTVRPSRLRLPVLAVANSADEIAPPASAMPFLDAMTSAETRLIESPGEAGVVLQHLGILVGRQAFARVWPEIISWMRAHV